MTRPGKIATVQAEIDAKGKHHAKENKRYSKKSGWGLFRVLGPMSSVSNVFKPKKRFDKVGYDGNQNKALSPYMVGMLTA